MSDRDERSARWWLVASTGAGVALVGVGLGLEAAWDWDGASVAIAINLGTAVGLAGLLHRVERRFAGEIADVQAAVDELRAPPTPIDQVSVAAAQRLGADHGRRKERIKALTDGIDESSVREAMAGVVEVSGLLDSQLTVRTGGSLRDPRISFGWSDDGLTVTLLAADAGRHGMVSAPLSWDANDGSEQMAIAIREVARIDLSMTLDNDFAWWGAALVELKHGLDLALERQAKGLPRLAEVGPKRRLLVTEAGLETTDGEVLLSRFELDPLAEPTRYPSGVTLRQVREMARAATVHLPVSRLVR